MTRIRFAEAATEGHPDSLADIVADTILDSYLAQDPHAKVACEVFVGKNLLVIGGEFTSSATVDIEMTARRAVREIGYTSADQGFSANDCQVIISASGQSDNLQQAVNFESQRDMGAGDTAVITGFAERNETGMIPSEMYFARKLAIMLCKLRRTELEYLEPDGKVMIALDQTAGGAFEVYALCISAQHSADVDRTRVARDLLDRVPGCLPPGFITPRTQVFVNPPNGSFCQGGPSADTGLTGRKTISSTYGPRVAGGGGALSGKDPSKIDRCGAYGARFVAKQLVQAGAADRVIVRLAYVLGHSKPVFVSVIGQSFAASANSDLTGVTLADFDLRPGALIERLALCRPIYAHCSRVGHFGIDPMLPWETTW